MNEPAIASSLKGPVNLLSVASKPNISFPEKNCNITSNETNKPDILNEININLKFKSLFSSKNLKTK